MKKTLALLIMLTIVIAAPAPVPAQRGDSIRIPLCHQDGEGRVRLIWLVNEHAVAAHLQHGDQGPQTFYRDADGDGLGDPASTIEACSQPEGFVSNSDDCNDTVAGAGCDQTVFAWEVSFDGGATWLPVALPDTNWGCTFCTRLYRTFVQGTPSAVSFRFASDNEARMFVNGTVVFDDYYINGVDWCTTAACCSECCDTPTSCRTALSDQFALTGSALSAFGPGINEIRWQVNQQTGGSGFYTEMSVRY